MRALESYPALTQSATWWTKLREGLLASDVQREINLRTPWFTAGNQGKQASCVGHAVADLIELQRRSSFDPPSARFIWQAAKEMDGDERPTTMIAAAGTSLRAALAVVKHYGYATESQLPTASSDLYYGDLDDFYAALARRKAEYIVNLGGGAKSWLAWLQGGRPIVMSMKVGDRFLATGKGQLIAAEDPKKDWFTHALLLVGYRFNEEAISTYKEKDKSKGKFTVKELLGVLPKSRSRRKTTTTKSCPSSTWCATARAPAGGMGGTPGCLRPCC